MKIFYKIFIRNRQCFTTIYLYLFIISLVIIIYYKKSIQNDQVSYTEVIYQEEMDSNNFVSDLYIDHNLAVAKYYEKRQHWNTSNLGTMLFKNEPFPAIQKDKIFTVLIWKHWNWLQKRLLHGYNSHRTDPLNECSVKNCIFIGDDDKLKSADAVVVHIQKGQLPDVRNRSQEQIWIYLNDESPINAFSMTKKRPDLSNWANVFNWSMMYRTDADIPVPYGRTVLLKKPILTNLNYEDLADLIPKWKIKQRNVLTSVLMSNCGSHNRMKFLKEFQKYITMDFYGKCSESEEKKNRCRGYFQVDCDVISTYLFYLVLENSECTEYLTEKSFYNAYSKGAIPVILGPPAEDCQRLLPPNSYLYVNDYETPEELALKIKTISQDEKTLLSYHLWRNHFEVLNEHGYFGSNSYHLCRICEALNYNSDKERIQDEESLKSFLDPKLSCGNRKS